MLMPRRRQLSFATNSLLLSICFLLQSMNRARSDDASWIDPDTPVSAQTVVAMGGRTLHLVFSDEFEQDDRTFADGDDTRWTAEDRPGTTNAALHYYNSSKVKTRSGNMVIQTANEAADWIEYDINDNGTQYPFHRDYQTGMVTTWNKFCYTSGMVEIAFRLPGKPHQPGLWPAFWMLGNLARPSYLSSTDKIWPWSWDTCGNSTEARDARLAQERNACNSGRGRGSPEIDIIEAQPGDYVVQYPMVPFVNGSNATLAIGRPMIASSLQIAPGVQTQLRPETPAFPSDGEWYNELFPLGTSAYGNYSPSIINNYWYGQIINEDPVIWQDGLSVIWESDPTFYKQITVMRMEWQTGKSNGYVRFLYDDQVIFEISSDVLQGKPGASDAIPHIPYEAMYLILNTDVSPRWGWNGCDPNDECVLANPGFCNAELQLACTNCSNPECFICPSQSAWFASFCEDIAPYNPAEYLIDYIRIYQDPTDESHTVGCDPPGLTTSDYIEQHWERYTFNPYINKQPLVNVTHGGAVCSSDLDCGTISTQDTWRGLCQAGQCSCPPDWTGPRCQVPCIGPYAYCLENSAENGTNTTTNETDSNNVNVPQSSGVAIAGWNCAPKSLLAMMMAVTCLVFATVGLA